MVGKSHHPEQHAVVVVGRANQLRLDSIQHQLRPTKHEEVAEVVDLAPREIQKALTPFAVHRRAPEIKLTIDPGDDPNIQFPQG